MNLGELLATIDSLDDALTIFAHVPWEERSGAAAALTAPTSRLEPLCTVREAKALLTSYVGDPTRIRVARIVARAEKLRDERLVAEQQARDFFACGAAVGHFEDRELPSRAGTYRYMPYRCEGHAELHDMLARGLRVPCVVPGRLRFFAVRFPSTYVIEIDEVVRLGE